MELRIILLLLTFGSTIFARPQDDYGEPDYGDENEADDCAVFFPGKFEEPELQYK